MADPLKNFPNELFYVTRCVCLGAASVWRRREQQGASSDKEEKPETPGPSVFDEAKKMSPVRLMEFDEGDGQDARDFYGEMGAQTPVAEYAPPEKPADAAAADTLGKMTSLDPTEFPTDGSSVLPEELHRYASGSGSFQGPTTSTTTTPPRDSPGDNDDKGRGLTGKSSRFGAQTPMMAPPGATGSNTGFNADPATDEAARHGEGEGEGLPSPGISFRPSRYATQTPISSPRASSRPTHTEQTPAPTPLLRPAATGGGILGDDLPPATNGGDAAHGWGDDDESSDSSFCGSPGPSGPLSGDLCAQTPIASSRPTHTEQTSSPASKAAAIGPARNGFDARTHREEEESTDSPPGGSAGPSDSLPEDLSAPTTPTAPSRPTRMEQTPLPAPRAAATGSGVIGGDRPPATNGGEDHTHREEEKSTDSPPGGSAGPSDSLPEDLSAPMTPTAPSRPTRTEQTPLPAPRMAATGSGIVGGDRPPATNGGEDHTRLEEEENTDSPPGGSRRLSGSSPKDSSTKTPIKATRIGFNTPMMSPAPPQGQEEQQPQRRGSAAYPSNRPRGPSSSSSFSSSAASSPGITPGASGRAGGAFPAEAMPPPSRSPPQPPAAASVPKPELVTRAAEGGSRSFVGQTPISTPRNGAVAVAAAAAGGTPAAEEDVGDSRAPTCSEEERPPRPPLQPLEPAPTPGHGDPTGTDAAASSSVPPKDEPQGMFARFLLKAQDSMSRAQMAMSLDLEAPETASPEMSPAHISPLRNNPPAATKSGQALEAEAKAKAGAVAAEAGPSANAPAGSNEAKADGGNTGVAGDVKAADAGLEPGGE